jgi:hypothetical protein
VLMLKPKSLKSGVHARAQSAGEGMADVNVRKERARTAMAGYIVMGIRRRWKY